MNVIRRNTPTARWQVGGADATADRENTRDGRAPFETFEDELQLLALVAEGRNSREPSRLQRRPRRQRLLRRALLIGDMLACVAAILVMEFTVGRPELRDVVITLLLIPGFAGWAILAHLYGLYTQEKIGFGRSTVDDVPDLLLLTTLATWLGLIVLVETGLAHPRLRNLIIFWLAYLTTIIVFRMLSRASVRRFRTIRQRTLVVGAGRVGALIGRKLAVRPQYGLEVVGYLDDEPLAGNDTLPHLGGIRDLERVIRAQEIERVIVAFSLLPGESQVELCRRCMDLDVQVDIVPRMYEVIGAGTAFHSLDGLPLLALKAPRLSTAPRLLKRVMDVVVASLALASLGPFFLYAAIRTKASSPGPVFFRQERMGAGGRRFAILKFRTMVVDADLRKSELEHLNKHKEAGPRMFKVPNDPRVTRFGRFLRAWSLDELPQLINILRGEMSLVGPRPLILDEDEHVLGQHRRRLRLTPGITGLWQVLGRSDIPFAEMVTLDYLYVTNWSLWGDVKLLSKTVPVVLQRRGAY